MPAGSGIIAKNSNVTVITPSSDSSIRDLGLEGSNGAGANSPGGLINNNDGFGIAIERQNISISSGTLISQLDLDVSTTLNRVASSKTDGNAYISGGTDQYASGNITVDSYLMFLGANSSYLSQNYAQVLFEGEIVGIFFDLAKTRAQVVDNVTYHNTSAYTYDMDQDGANETATNDEDRGRIIEPGSGSGTGFFGNDASSVHSADWVSVGDYNGTNNYLRFGATNSNTKTGDYIRILVKPTSGS